MAFPERNLTQVCVYWGTPARDGYGTFTWATPVEISCRWVDSIKVVMGKDGNEIITQAEVQVKQVVDEQGMLYLGELTDLSAAEKADPKLKDTVYSIKKFDQVPTMKGDKFFRKCYL